MLSVKGAGIGGLIAVVRILADGRPFLRIRAAGAGSIGSVRVKCTIVEDDVVHQHSARAAVLRLAVGAIDNIPEPLQLVGGADLIGVALRTAAGGCVVKDAAGDGAVVDDLAVECAFFDGAAGGNGHFALWPHQNSPLYQRLRQRKNKRE